MQPERRARGKEQRGHELPTPKDRRKIHDLYYRHLIERDLIAERFGLDEAAVVAILRAPRPDDVTRWQVRWDDARGERCVRVFNTFEAAKQCHAALRGVEWSRVERV